MTYQQLEKIRKTWKGKVCIYGAGLIGRTWGYDILEAAGFKINYLCDKKFSDSEDLQNEIKKISINQLFKIKEKMLVFVTVSQKFQREIFEQLKEYRVHEYVPVDYLFLTEFLESIIASENQEIIKNYHRVIDDKEYLKKQFYYQVGYELNLEQPQTFNEKLQWLKIYDRKPIYTRLVDKYEFKKFIEEKIGKEYVIPTLGVWNSINEINFDYLPKQFVMKCTHDSGSVILCKDKSNFDIEGVKEKLLHALNKNHFWYGREWPYKNVKPRIMAEEYIEDNKHQEIIDYKFLCFNGKYKCAFTCTDRFKDTGLKVTFFNKEWEKMDIERHYPASKEEIEKPYNYNKMIIIAEKLAENTKFVRIDFYEVDRQLYLSEFTLYPGAGFEEFSNWEQDKQFGDWLELN